jgi:RNA polymerase sigma-70 factor (ECF subfamily)
MGFSENIVSDEQLYQLRLDKLQRAMEGINPNDKVLLIMKYQDDFSIKEIMETLAINESAVKMRLNRAKSKLLEVYNNIN